MIVTPFTYKPRRGLLTTTPSLTVPDEAMSIKEIFEQYAKNPQGAFNQEFYGEDVEIPNVQALDPVERQELQNSISNHIEKNKNFLLEKQKENQDRADREEEAKAKAKAVQEGSKATASNAPSD